MWVFTTIIVKKNRANNFSCDFSEETRVCRLEAELDHTLVDEPHTLTKSDNIDDCMMNCRKNMLCMSATLDVTGDRPECRLFQSSGISTTSPGSWVWRKYCEPGQSVKLFVFFLFVFSF